MSYTREERLDIGKQIYDNELSKSDAAVKNMAYDYQNQSLAGHRWIPKWIRNKNIGTTQPGLKWNDFSPVTSVVMAWDASLLTWKEHNLRPSHYLYSCRICLRFRSGYFWHLSGYTTNIWYKAGNTS